VTAPLIEVRGAVRHFTRRPAVAERILMAVGRAPPPPVVRAVENVDLAIFKGEVMGLVGESGCGKSTLARMITGILEPTAGEVLFEGRAVNGLGRRERLKYLLAVQMIFQDPFASLDPRMKVGRIVGEAMAVHRLVPRKDIGGAVDRVLADVGLDPAYRGRYPHQFSGGQRQRIGIARALAVKPRVLVCDEPVAALDVSIQAQVINLFMDLRERHALTYLFVSHNLGLVKYLCDRVAIMYLGRIVETGPVEQIFEDAAHPYTQALLESLPRLHRRKRIFEPVKGELPSAIAPPPGCAFHPRCPSAMPECRQRRPELREIAPGRTAACHLLTRL
jgi:peptide/nickel transport system ATP-binding protein